jgi:hypothetical protein
MADAAIADAVFRGASISGSFPPPGDRWVFSETVLTYTRQSYRRRFDLPLTNSVAKALHGLPTPSSIVLAKAERPEIDSLSVFDGAGIFATPSGATNVGYAAFAGDASGTLEWGKTSQWFSAAIGASTFDPTAIERPTAWLDTRTGPPWSGSYGWRIREYPPEPTAELLRWSFRFR